MPFKLDPTASEELALPARSIPAFSRAAIEHMTPDFDPGKIDVSLSSSTLNRIFLGPDHQILIKNFPGRPSIFSYPSSIFRQPVEDSIPEDNRVVHSHVGTTLGHLFENCATRQEHGIPQGSMHYRVG